MEEFGEGFTHFLRDVYFVDLLHPTRTRFHICGVRNLKLELRVNKDREGLESQITLADSSLYLHAPVGYDRAKNYEEVRTCECWHVW